MYLSMFVSCLQRAQNMDLHRKVEAVIQVSNCVTVYYYVSINALLLCIDSKLWAIKAILSRRCNIKVPYNGSGHNHKKERRLSTLRYIILKSPQTTLNSLVSSPASDKVASNSNSILVGKCRAFVQHMSHISLSVTESFIHIPLCTANCVHEEQQNILEVLMLMLPLQRLTLDLRKQFLSIAEVVQYQRYQS